MQILVTTSDSKLIGFGVMPFDIKSRVASLLLPELKEGKRGWYYISIAHDDGFRGGIFVQAFGITDAWCITHSLNLIEKDCETQTSGPIDEKTIEKVPTDMRWRKLNKEEVRSLDDK